MLLRQLRKFSTIKAIRGREIIDSRGNPTVEAEVLTSKGVFRAAVPSGASTGIYEANELRDQDPKRFNGKGVLQAVNNINTVISKGLVGLDCTKQEQLDRFMVETLDGTKNQYGWTKAKLGANSILAVSLAVARAGAAEKNTQLYKYISDFAGRRRGDKFITPVPSLNVINGGKHAGNLLAMQEFMILPTGFNTFRESLQGGAEVYHALQKLIKKKYGIDATNVGDEGGFAPPTRELDSLELLKEAIHAAGHEGKIDIGLDCASSEFFVPEKNMYDLDFKNTKGDKKLITKEQLLDVYADFCKKYNIVSIEDPFDQDDWEGWSMITKKLGDKVQIVGDDLLVTNPKRIQMALQKKSCNALLLKVNQIGTLTESVEAANDSFKNGWGVMVSHRSGETEDSFIADLAVGLQAGEIKTGAPCRSERLAKYNQILRIEEELGENAVFAGKSFRNPWNLI